MSFIKKIISLELKISIPELDINVEKQITITQAKILYKQLKPFLDSLEEITGSFPVEHKKKWHKNSLSGLHLDPLNIERLKTYARTREKFRLSEVMEDLKVDYMMALNLCQYLVDNQFLMKNSALDQVKHVRYNVYSISLEVKNEKSTFGISEFPLIKKEKEDLRREVEKWRDA